MTPRFHRSALTFVNEAVRRHHWTGALTPSSPFLAREMTAAACRAPSPKRILEVGPGSGPMTRPLLRALRPGDTFDLVEINPTFCRRLEDDLLTDFRARNPDVTVRLYTAPVQEAPLEGPYDYIVCSLPFNLFPLVTVREIFRGMLSVLREGGELTYFEYVGMSAMKVPVVGREGRQMIRRRTAIKRVLDRRHNGRRALVLGNVPPAIAYHLHRK